MLDPVFLVLKEIRSHLVERFFVGIQVHGDCSIVGHHVLILLRQVRHLVRLRLLEVRVANVGREK